MRKNIIFSILISSVLTVPVLAENGAAAAGDLKTSAGAVIPVELNAEDEEVQYSFTIEKDPSDPEQTIESEVLSLKDGETGNFVLGFIYPGTYHYSIKQLAGEDKDTMYDESVYNAEVFVSEDDSGVMNTEAVVVYKEGEEKKQDSVEFTNLSLIPGFDPDGDEPEDPDKEPEEPEDEPSENPGEEPGENPEGDPGEKEPEPSVTPGGSSGGTSGGFSGGGSSGGTSGSAPAVHGTGASGQANTAKTGDETNPLGYVFALLAAVSAAAAVTKKKFAKFQ